jgi:hydrogenase maturation protease
MSDPGRTPLLVLGLGNLLCTDDGLGAVAVHRLLREYEPPEGAVVLDGGTLGMALLPHLESADVVVLVDAIRTDDPPGTLVRLEGEDVAPAVAARLSVHQVGVVDLLDSARLLDCYPPKVILLGLVPASLGLGVELTPAVDTQLPLLVTAVVEEARALGFAFVERDGDAMDAVGGSGRLAVALGL